MPKLSVILPVYNGEKYLHAAIESILAQSFTDFEMLVMNDGSTDGSAAIISSFNDPRVIAIENEKNRGLIYTLNRGIDLAKGEFIARMDADDIALPERFARQIELLEKEDVAMVATTVKLIDEEGNPLPDWKADVNNISLQNIKTYLLRDNCIAHPTVMGKTSVFRSYKYRFNQKYSEDYDLWLRLVADGKIIHKIDEPLLLHRILPTSATRFKKVNVFYRLAKVKFRFLWQQVSNGRLTSYQTKIFVHGMLDLIKAGGKEVKRLLAK